MSPQCIVFKLEIALEEWWEETFSYDENNPPNNSFIRKYKDHIYFHFFSTTYFKKSVNGLIDKFWYQILFIIVIFKRNNSFTVPKLRRLTKMCVCGCACLCMCLESRNDDIGDEIGENNAEKVRRS